MMNAACHAHRWVLPLPNARTANSSSSKNVADVLARPMSSLATDGAIPGAKATQAQQVYGNSEGGGHQGSSVVKPEKYEVVDTPTPPPEINNAAVGSSNGGSGNGQTQNGEMKIKKKKKGGGGKIRIKLNLPDKNSTFYTLQPFPITRWQAHTSHIRSADTPYLHSSVYLTYHVA